MTNGMLSKAGIVFGIIESKRPPMNISFKVGEITYGGVVTPVPKATETQYFLELGGSEAFTIRLTEDGIWETDNPEIDPELVSAAGNQVECMEDLAFK